MNIYVSEIELEAFSQDLNANGIEHRAFIIRQDTLDGESSLACLEVLGKAAVWSALAKVICAYIKARYGRKATLTCGDKSVHIEGMTEEELAKLLESADRLTITSPED